MAFFESGWFGSLIGVAGILLSLYFYLKDKIGARLDYQMAELKILDHNNLALGMKVQYFDRPISKLVKTQIVIWNSGRKTIEGNMIVAGDPLRLSFDSSEVLGCNVTFFSRGINKCTVYKDENSNNSVFINFEFLDSQDGVIIDILHTGEEIYPKFLGSIKGMKDKIRNRGISPYPVIEFVSKKNKTFFFLVNMITFIIFGLIITGLLYLFEKLYSESIWDNKISIGMGISLGLLLFRMNFNFLKRRKAPKKINQYSSEFKLE